MSTATTEETLYERHVKIRPRPVKGRFASLRKTALLVLLGIFHILPFFQWNGRQAIFFDMPHRRFYIFGLNIWPQDFILLTFILLGLALLLFFATALLGRVWCGYACPHTVYTEVFLWIEQKIEGNRSEQLKLAREPWRGRKGRKRILKYSLWAGVALAAGIGFVGYFTPICQLIPDFFTLRANPQAYLWVALYGGFCYLQAGIVREQFCKYLCPYARFQGAMFDRDTLIIAYDAKRGEPRRRLKKQDREHPETLGFCVDCTMCVQVCPTGIDIRDGLQLDCIACAVDKLIADFGGFVWNEEGFDRLRDFVRENLNEVTVDIAQKVEQILTLTHQLNQRLKGKMDFTMAFALSDIKSQIAGLIYQGFVQKSGYARLPDLLRYLQAIDKRMDKLAQDVNRDRAAMLRVEQVQQAYQQLLAKLPKSKPISDEVAEIRYMIEELRVSLFAQQLGTKYQVSEKRVLAIINAQ